MTDIFKTIVRLQIDAGLHDPAVRARLSAEELVDENARVLADALGQHRTAPRVVRDKVAELRQKARDYAAELTAPPARLLFELRRHSRRLRLEPDDADTGSRFGGRPPAAVVARAPRCPVCDGPLRYVWTLAAELLGCGEPGQLVTLLRCQDGDCMWRAHRALIEPSPLVLLSHEDGPRSRRRSELDGAHEGRRLAIGPIVPEPREGYNRSKIGGPLTAPAPEALGGRVFVAQIGDSLLNRYRDGLNPPHLETMATGSYDFSFGYVCLFARPPKLRGWVATWSKD